MAAKLERFSQKQLQVLAWWCAGSPWQDRTAIICDGAVRSGKTLCLGLGFITWAFYAFEGRAFAVCGKTIRSVKRNLIATLLPVLEANGFHCALHHSENRLHVRCGERKNDFYLFGGRDEGSSALIQGMTLAGVLLDEVALMPRSFVEQALARCSLEGSRFWFNCNPEGPQHWFYQEWIRKAEEKKALHLHFRMEDNPSLSTEMRRRYESLYSGTFYERFILGSWTAAQGLVYPFMDAGIFTAPPENCRAYRVSCDYGTANPCSIGLWGLSENTWYRIDEYYFDSRREGYQKTDEEHYRALEALCGQHEVEWVVVDPSAASFIQTIRRHGRFVVIPAVNDVMDGIRRVSVVLKEGRVRICRGCRDAVREFGLYRWNDSRAADTPKKENDHAMDDIRYFVAQLEEEEDFWATAAVRR